MLRWSLALLCLLPFAVGSAAEGQEFPSAEESDLAMAGLTPEQAGLAIFQEADRRASGYGDLKVDLEMTLKTSNGSESTRELRIRQLEMEEDGDRLLVVFDTPKSIRGTALLSYAHKRTPDDQWIYLPALKRVKRIASQNRSGPFLSSEFAYEDMALQEVEKYRYRLLETHAGEHHEYYVVERVPNDAHSGYGRQVVTVDGEAFRIHRVEYYDRQNRLLKTLQVDGYLQHAERFWKPARMLMANVQTGKSTELRWQNFEFDTGQDAERDFSTNSLRRAR